MTNLKSTQVVRAEIRALLGNDVFRRMSMEDIMRILGYNPNNRDQYSQVDGLFRRDRARLMEQRAIDVKRGRVFMQTVMAELAEGRLPLTCIAGEFGLPTEFEMGEFKSGTARNQNTGLGNTLGGLAGARMVPAGLLKAPILTAIRARGWKAMVEVKCLKAGKPSK